MAAAFDMTLEEVFFSKDCRSRLRPAGADNEL